MSKKTKAPRLPKPADPDAQFCTVCPKCKEDHTLYVSSGVFRVMGMNLHEDGFAFADAEQVETEDEMVYCRHCDETFPLSEVTR